MWKPDVPEILIAFGIVACLAWALYNRAHWHEGIRK
jgi:hypothetical protein